MSPANQFWGINQQIRYGTSTSILSNTAGIVDTGTTLTLIATGAYAGPKLSASTKCFLDALARYQTATGAVFDDVTGLLQLTLAQFASLQSLFFTINGVTVEFTANAQIWPVRLTPQALYF